MNSKLFSIDFKTRAMDIEKTETFLNNQQNIKNIRTIGVKCYEESDYLSAFDCFSIAILKNGDRTAYKNRAAVLEKVADENKEESMRQQQRWLAVSDYLIFLGRKTTSPPFTACSPEPDVILMAKMKLNLGNCLMKYANEEWESVLNNNHGKRYDTGITSDERSSRRFQDILTLYRTAAEVFCEILPSTDNIISLYMKEIKRNLFFCYARLVALEALEGASVPEGMCKKLKNCTLCWKQGKLCKSHVIMNSMLKQILEKVGAPADGMQTMQTIVDSSSAGEDAKLADIGKQKFGSKALSWEMLCGPCERLMRIGEDPVNDLFFRDFVRAAERQVSINNAWYFPFFSASLVWRAFFIAMDKVLLRQGDLESLVQLQTELHSFLHQFCDPASKYGEDVKAARDALRNSIIVQYPKLPVIYFVADRTRSQTPPLDIHLYFHSTTPNFWLSIQTYLLHWIIPSVPFRKHFSSSGLSTVNQTIMVPAEAERNNHFLDLRFQGLENQFNNCMDRSETINLLKGTLSADGRRVQLSSLRETITFAKWIEAQRKRICFPFNYRRSDGTPDDSVCCSRASTCKFKHLCYDCCLSENPNRHAGCNDLILTKTSSLKRFAETPNMEWTRKEKKQKDCSITLLVPPKEAIPNPPCRCSIDETFKDGGWHPIYGNAVSVEFDVVFHQPDQENKINNKKPPYTLVGTNVEVNGILHEQYKQHILFAFEHMWI